MQNLHFITAFLLLQLCGTAIVALNQEGDHLFDAKLALFDPNNALANWNPADATPCNWTGVICSSVSAGGGGDLAVTAVDLSGLDLTGPFPSSLCLLPKLSFLSLSLNYINSSLTNSSLFPCSSLTHLDLSQNLLVGPIPSSLPSLSRLRHLDLAGNNFSGAIPPSFALFPSLEVISLTANLLDESIPSFLGNISTLRELNLSYNPFAAGLIPPSLANLTNLETIWLAGCGLVGEIPPPLGHLSKLTNLDLSSNSLSGSIPDTLSGLSSIIQIELYKNSLTGRFPSRLSNLTALRRIDVSMNHLSGPIPDDVFSIPLLESLHLYQNQFTGSLPVTVTTAPNLLELRIFRNRLTGPLPANLGTNLPLRFLDLSDNRLTGEIPKGVCGGSVLQELLLINNLFSGSLPQNLGKCRTLTRIRLANNQLSGDVPVDMWGLPRLRIIELTDNSFTGGIATGIAGATNLSNLLISRNQFSGNIPSEIGALSKLSEFSASDNRLTGSLPVSLRSLLELEQLDLHNNSLSGELLTGIQNWKNLIELKLADNKFSGQIPSEIGNLPVLNYLDLSGNILTGEIPSQLQYLKLNQFNLSNNQLSGSIPPAFNNEAYRSSFLGNPSLCKDLNGPCSSSTDVNHGRHRSYWLLGALIMFAAVVFIVGVAIFYFKYKNNNKGRSGQGKSKWILTSFHKLSFSEHEILNSLYEYNVIGSGASGKVYKVVLGNGVAVAVKQLWKTKALKNDDGNQDEAAYDAFESEVATLGKIRHKNIVKLWCCCSQMDYKLLVYEYMPNGSLGDLLHSSKANLLDWPMRYRIASDASEGLCYLHHDCVPPIVHRDVKSNNILLDAELHAKVADFGVAKVVDGIGKGPKSMSVIAGSCGYIAPEYAYTLRVNEKSDIYSFGVVLLELITGKPPIGPEFGEKDLVNWVCSTIHQKGEEYVIDSKLDLTYKEQITKVLHIALLCTCSLPINRPSMRRVVKMLLEESKSSHQPKEGKLAPYYYDDQESFVSEQL